MERNERHLLESLAFVNTSANTKPFKEMLIELAEESKQRLVTLPLEKVPAEQGRVQAFQDILQRMDDAQKVVKK